MGQQLDAQPAQQTRRSRASRRLSRNRLTRGALRLGAVCSLAIAAGAATMAPAGAQTIDPPVPQPVVADADSTTLAAMVNEYRVANGLNPLVIDPGFSSATAPHALLLSSLNPAPVPPAGYAFWCPEATASTFYHDSNANQLASAPAGSVSYGENIAYRCSPTFAGHANDIMTGWRNSPGHDQNMLNPSWTHIASVAVRWNNTTIAVHRFASVPGTPVPAVTATIPTAPTPAPVVEAAPADQSPATASAPGAADDDAGRALDPAASDPTPSDTTSADNTAADATPDDAAADESTADATPNDDASAATAPSNPAVPQLAFTGTNLNLVFLGIALIASGLGVLALPAVRQLDDEV